MGGRQEVEDGLKTAMKAAASAVAGSPEAARAAVRLATFRMLKSAVKYREIELGRPLDDAGVAAVVGSLLRERREAADAFRGGGRPELAAKEEAEAAVLRELLPEPLSAEALEKLVAEAAAEAGASGPSDLGKVMRIAKEKAAGRADGRTLSEAVKAHLGKG